MAPSEQTPRRVSHRSVERPHRNSKWRRGDLVSLLCPVHVSDTHLPAQGLGTRPVLQLWRLTC